MARVALLGGGKMGAALVGGLLDGGYDPDDVGVAEVDPERRRDLEARFPKVRVAPTGAWAVADADVVIVAVKPGDVPAALTARTPGAAARRTRTLDRRGRHHRNRRSRRAGSPRGAGDAEHARARRARRLGHRARGDRDRGASRARGRGCSRAVGIVVRVEEHQLDAVTGLSGSGPAYVMLVAEALTEAGVLVGLPRPIANQLVEQTLLGAATLLAHGDDGPETLRAAVTSPGGTTAAGLRELEARGVRAAFLDAVAAATERSRELGRKDASPS